MKIFLDDSRICPADFTVARTVEEFEKLVTENKDDLEVISLDFDLSESGTGRTGLNACDFLVKNHIRCPKIIIHSTHPNAAVMYSFLEENMQGCEIVLKKYSIIDVMENY